MNLKGRIDADLKTAMLSRDTLQTELLRGLKSAILYREVALKKRDEGLSESEIEQVLASEAKKRDESIEMFDKGGKPELADKERKEKQIIETYLPAKLSEAEVARIVDEEVDTLGASGPAAMGQIIGKVKARTGSQAEGSLIAQLVKQKLN